MREIAPRPRPWPPRGSAASAGAARSVRLLKIALPLVVVVTLGYLGYWWLESRGTVVDAT